MQERIVLQPVVLYGYSARCWHCALAHLHKNSRPTNANARPQMNTCNRVGDVSCGVLDVMNWALCNLFFLAGYCSVWSCRCCCLK